MLNEVIRLCKNDFSGINKEMIQMDRCSYKITNNLDIYLLENCILTGSRGMGLGTEYSDYNFAMTEEQFDEIVKLGYIGNTILNYTSNSGSGNKLYNKKSLKFHKDDKEYNFIIYEDESYLNLIYEITKAVSSISVSKDKSNRHYIFETLCTIIFEDIKSKNKLIIY